MSSWLDGFAKLHSFKFDGANVYFSGKMIESTTYMDSVANGELVPQITLNAMANPEDEWTFLEVGEMLYKMTNQWNNFGDGKHNGVNINCVYNVSVSTFNYFSCIIVCSVRISKYFFFQEILF